MFSQERRTMILYHTGFDIIKDPDLKRGRVNADFGQGFYLSDDENFSHRWARKRSNCTTYVNEYELDTTDLKIVRFTKNEEWYDFIFKNRRGKNDIEADVDVIIGPIANDTIYATMGILSSGYLSKETSLKILQYGNEYTQIVIRSQRAKQQLIWKNAVIVNDEELQKYSGYVEEETNKFQLAIAEILEKEEDE